jgi:hypothetical protein
LPLPLTSALDSDFGLDAKQRLVQLTRLSKKSS